MCALNLGQVTERNTDSLRIAEFILTKKNFRIKTESFSRDIQKL